MRMDRLRPVHRADDAELTKGVIEVIVTADDVGHAHVVIVDDDGEHVGRCAVRAEQDHVVEFGILHGDGALHAIGNRRRALALGLEPDDVREAGRCGRRIGIAPRALQPERELLGLGLGAGRGELLLRHEAGISVPARHHRARDLGMALGAGKLEDGITVPVEPSQRMPSRIASIAGSVERARSVSSIRSRKRPP